MDCMVPGLTPKQEPEHDLMFHLKQDLDASTPFDRQAMTERLSPRAFAVQGQAVPIEQRGRACIP
jgi:hypothetical protein